MKLVTATDLLLSLGLAIGILSLPLINAFDAARSRRNDGRRPRIFRPRR